MTEIGAGISSPSPSRKVDGDNFSVPKENPSIPGDAPLPAHSFHFLLVLLSPASPNPLKARERSGFPAWLCPECFSTTYLLPFNQLTPL